ncbi:hypothetical protein HPB51_025305 [Rhipicephalus microplus]|uniref:Uncharacterized protein n=1 Tax=Rhipicephalus microplus TaxID=6941 RepID=A0A9J6F8K7_RHIMP|nr:hypothetical protein HPB51_025305 [Rhipicephalus microplus]
MQLPRAPECRRGGGSPDIIRHGPGSQASRSPPSQIKAQERLEEPEAKTRDALSRSTLRLTLYDRSGSNDLPTGIPRLPNYDARRLEREGWLASALINGEQETNTKRAHRTDMANEWFRRNAPHPRVRKITFSVGRSVEKNEDKLPFRSIVRAKRASPMERKALRRAPN